MAKFSGLVGFVTQSETSPGVWSSVENPVMMRGDVIRQSSNGQNGDKVNSDVSLGHRISLVGDAYSLGNCHDIRWVELHGKKWVVSSVEIQRPRIVVSLGGVWNG